MKKYVDACKYLVKNKTTIRDAANEYGISKSALHRYIHESLYNHCIIHDCTQLFPDVINQIYINYDERQYRGGMATKKMYENRKIK